MIKNKFLIVSEIIDSHVFIQNNLIPNRLKHPWISGLADLGHVPKYAEMLKFSPARFLKTRLIRIVNVTHYS